MEDGGDDTQVGDGEWGRGSTPRLALIQVCRSSLLHNKWKKYVHFFESRM